ncbi:MAG: PilZ domain-containing protein [Candidatus Omnitrophica bacterium]|nr:PilZ domain-containing protein [Candidatus Omnitrophota bacterium]
MDECAELNLSELYRILWKRKATFITLFGIVFFSVLIVSVLMPPTYRASSKIITQNESALYPADIMPRTTDDKVYLNSQKEKISSRYILDKVLSDVQNKGLAKGLTYKGLKETISIDYLNGSNLLEVTVDRKNENEAMELANSISSTFINYHVGSKKEFIDQNLGILTKKTNALRTDIEGIEAKLKGLSDKEQLNFYQGQVPYFVTGLVELNNKNISAESDIERMQLELNRTDDTIKGPDNKFIYPVLANALGESPRASLNEHPWIDNLRKKIVDKENELEEVLSGYTEDHPKAKALTSQIASLNNALDLAIKKMMLTYKDYYKGYIEFLKSQKKTNNSGKEVYAANLDSISKNIQKAAIKQIEYQTLLKTCDIKQNIYMLFLQKQKELELLKEEVSNVNLSNIRVFEPASLPLKRVSPNIPLNLLLGALFGALIGISGSLMTEKKYSTPQRYKTPQAPMTTERRLMSRLGKGLYVEYEMVGDAAHKKYQAVTKDISVSGARIQTNTYLSKGTQIFLKISINGSHAKDTIEATGEVIWTNPPSKKSDTVEGGLHFTNISPQEREKLINYLYKEHYLTKKSEGLIWRR